MQVYDRWCRLQVSEVMSREVISVSSHETLPRAASRLLDHKVTAAPVVDELGHCVGILSGSDFLRLASQGGIEALSKNRLHRAGDSAGPSESWHSELPAEELVADHMCPALQTIHWRDTLAHAARILHWGQLHRLPVLDDEGRIVGLLSSHDLLGALLRLAGDEQ